MINAIFKGILSALNQLINLVTIGIDMAISAAFPNMSEHITLAVQYFQEFLNNLTYVVTWIPQSFTYVLALIFSLQVTFIVLDKTVDSITRIYTIIQKIKFW